MSLSTSPEPSAGLEPASPLTASRLGGGAGTRACANPLCSREVKDRDGRAIYCSRSCAATVNNVRYPKRTKTHRCRKCNAAIPRNWKVCIDCRPQPVLDQTLGAIRGRAKYQISSQIRNNARIVLRNSGTPAECRVCGYAVHVEVSHIRAISTYPPETPARQINDLSNLEYLCPSHHWEHENGLL